MKWNGVKNGDSWWFSNLLSSHDDCLFVKLDLGDPEDLISPEQVFLQIEKKGNNKAVTIMA